MAHAADTSNSRYPHGDGFFAQLEHLLRQGAPISLGMPEMPGHRFPLTAVPKKFPLCRRAAATLEAKRASQINRWRSEHKDVVDQVITDEDIVREFEDASFEMTWEVAKHVIGQEYGLIDCNGRPSSRRAGAILAQGKRRHTRARRDYLTSEKLRKQFDSEK